ncbi:MAG: hypothetical protein V3575_03310 [Candidatus Absconditabacteria bacterium]
MALIITLVLLTIGAALMTNVYSIFEPFLNNLKDVKDYNIAYYGAVSSIERANLILRHHTAGFEGSGGWLGDTKFGPNSDTFSGAYGVLYSPNTRNGISRSISSLNTGGTIPKEGFGNIDYDLQGSGSKNYNKLEYNVSEEMLLYIDPTNDLADYYTGITNTKKIEQLNISAEFRLPPKIEEGYNPSNNRDLDTTTDGDGDGIGDDNLVNWTIFGKHGSNNLTFYPTINVDYASSTFDKNLDSGIRESYINQKGSNTPISFATNFNPTNQIINQNGYSHNMNPTITNYTDKSRRYILNNNDFTDMHLKFSLVNYVEVADSLRYPFLEYKINFEDNSGGKISIPDRFFSVNGIGQVGRYKVTLKQSIPVVKSYGFSDFTIVF